MSDQRNWAGAGRFAVFVGRIASVAVLICALSSMAAGQIVVNTLTDGDASDFGDGLCSLREAVGNANDNTDNTLGDCNPGGGHSDHGK